VLGLVEHRALAAAARLAVEGQAEEPLPEEPGARAREGIRRSRRAVSAVVEQARAAQPCQCAPEQVRAAIESARLLVQTVYDFLVLFGVIGSNGKKERA